MLKNHIKLKCLFHKLSPLDRYDKNGRSIQGISIDEEDLEDQDDYDGDEGDIRDILRNIKAPVDSYKREGEMTKSRNTRCRKY